MSDPERVSSNSVFRFGQGDLTPFLNNEVSSRAFATVAGIGTLLTGRISSATEV